MHGTTIKIKNDGLHVPEDSSIYNPYCKILTCLITNGFEMYFALQLYQYIDVISYTNVI
jgi:hypothetical protein